MLIDGGVRVVGVQGNVWEVLVVFIVVNVVVFMVGVLLVGIWLILCLVWVVVCIVYGVFYIVDIMVYGCSFQKGFGEFDRIIVWWIEYFEKEVKK